MLSLCLFHHLWGTGQFSFPGCKLGCRVPRIMFRYCIQREKHLLMYVVLLARKIFSKSPLAYFLSGCIGQERVTSQCQHQSHANSLLLRLWRRPFPYTYIWLVRGIPAMGGFQQGVNEVMGMAIGWLIVPTILFCRCPGSKILNLNIEFDF